MVSTPHGIHTAHRAARRNTLTRTLGFAVETDRADKERSPSFSHIALLLSVSNPSPAELIFLPFPEEPGVSGGARIPCLEEELQAKLYLPGRGAGSPNRAGRRIPGTVA